MDNMTAQFLDAADDLEGAVLHVTRNYLSTRWNKIMHRKPVVSFSGARVLERGPQNRPDSQHGWVSSDLPDTDEALWELHYSEKEFYVILDFIVRTKRAAAVLNRLSAQLEQTAPAEFEFEGTSECGGANDLSFEFRFLP